MWHMLALSSKDEGNSRMPHPWRNLQSVTIAKGGEWDGAHRGRDVMSPYAQKIRGITVESLNVLQTDSDELRETIVEDRKAGPAEVAAARIDVGDWGPRGCR